MERSIDDVLATIAKRHGVALSTDDPVLVVYTLYSLILEDTQAGQNEMLQKLRSDLEDITHRWEEYTKSHAERSISAAVTSGNDAAKRHMAEIVEKFEAELSKKYTLINRELNESNLVHRSASTTSLINLGAAVIVLLAIAIDVIFN